MENTMSEDFDRFEMLDTYLLETSQILEGLQAVVMKYRDDDRFPDDAVDEIFRHMHTLKGSAGFMMFEQLHTLAHKTEDLFAFIRDKKPEGVSQPELIEKVLKVTDFVQAELDRLSDGKMADTSSAELVEEIDAYLNGLMKGAVKEEKKEDKPEDAVEPMTQIYIAPDKSKASHYYQIYILYQPGTPLANVHAYKIVHALRSVTEDIIYRPSNILTSLSSSDEILEQGFKILLKSSASKSKIEKIVSEGYETRSIEVTEIDAARYEGGLDLFGVDAGVVAKVTADEEEYAPGDFVVHSDAPGKGRKLAKDSTARKTTHVTVDEADLNKLWDLLMKMDKLRKKVGNDKEIEASGLELATFKKNNDKLEDVTKDLIGLVTDMRKIPLTNVFIRMNRIVFEASRKLGKPIECDIKGDDIKVDRGIVEHISEPLMHMVRNSADHGIETADIRLLSGKPPRGKITLQAKEEGSYLEISVSDDGAGLDRDAIISKARQKGLLDDNKRDDEYTDEEVWKFITLPGFSTNKQVTEFSGRGVGMDVVRYSVEEIGGSLIIESVKGQGSTMTMRFPL